MTSDALEETLCQWMIRMSCRRKEKLSVKSRNNLSEIKRLNCGRRMSRLAKKGRVKGKDQ